MATFEDDYWAFPESGVPTTNGAENQQAIANFSPSMPLQVKSEFVSSLAARGRPSRLAPIPGVRY